MDIEELDAEKLAELETMLYCQVFHSKETEDCQPTNTIPMEDNTNLKSNHPSTKPRYFEKQNKRVMVKGKSERLLYSKSPEKMKQQQNNPDATSPIQNNITINHYIYNVPGWTYGSDKEDDEKVNHLKKKLTNKKRPHKKIRQEIKNKIAKKMQQQSKRDRTHVIFISDDESSDGCQILTENGGSIDDGNSVSVISSNDEEVLFVPSEPCETIIDLDSEDEYVEHKEREQNTVIDESNSQKNVDANDGSKENNEHEEGNLDASMQESSNKNPKAIKSVTSNESHESNDFLDSGVVQDSRDSFDFQLHGSEFNQCSGRGEQVSASEQFVKPPNPSGDAPAAESHETESESTSSTTTGTDRACSNEFSLKNIVFQEVDFPKADIFADNDLHSFEKFITPQRGSQDSNEEVQEQPVAKEARTSRTSKIGTPKAVHTPSSRTPASVKARKGRSSAKSRKKHAKQAERVEEENEGSSDDSESSSESEFESSEGQRRRLPELSLMSQPETTGRKQKQQEQTDKDVDEVNIDSSEANEAVDGVGQLEDAENPTTSEESSTTSASTGVSWKRGDKNRKGKNKKSKLTKQQPGTKNKISKKRKKSKKATAPQQVVPVEQVVPIEEEEVPVDSPISVDVSSLNEQEDSDDDVELIEKPVEVIPVTDSDEEVEDIRLGVDGPSEEAQDTVEDDVQLNDVEKMPDKTVGDTPIDLDLVYANLTSDPSKWQISRKDKPSYPPALEQRQRSRGPRCNRCRRFGHTALKCTEKPEPPRCYLCGAEDHTEPRCPNKICLNCGNKGDYTTNYCYRCFKYRDLQCRLCLQQGHLATGCPDLWRRYHLTTGPGPIKVPVGPQLRPRHEHWCSGCASQGHLEHECYYYGRQYPPSLPYIVNYDNILFPDQPQQSSVVSTQNTPKKSTNPDAVTHSTDISGKRTPKNKPVTEIGSSANETGHTPQKRSKCVNDAQIVNSATTPQKQPSTGPTEGDQNLGEPVHTLPENRLFNLAGYRLQPRADPEMRLFSIAGYGIPSADVNEPRPDNDAVNVPGGSTCSRREPIAMNENVNGPQVAAATIPPLMSLEVQPTFDIGGFDRLPTGEELHWLENQNLGDGPEEMAYQGEDDLRYRLGPKSNQKMKEYFLSAPAVDLKEFVSSELTGLKKIRKINLESLKKRIVLAVTKHRAMQRKVNHTAKEIRKEMKNRDLYRRANMFLFGVRQLHFGRRHLATLNRLVSEDKGQRKGNAERHIPLKLRMSFYLAYDYIFGDELNRGINYPGLLGKMVNRKNKKKLKQQQLQQRQLQRYMKLREERPWAFRDTPT